MITDEFVDRAVEAYVKAAGWPVDVKAGARAVLLLAEQAGAEPEAPKHGPVGDGEPGYDDMADEYEISCVCGRTFTACTHDGAVEALQGHLRYEGVKGAVS